MTPLTAARRAIVALKARVKENSFHANLYLVVGVRSPEVVREWKDRQADLSAIQFYMELIENAKKL